MTKLQILSLLLLTLALAACSDDAPATATDAGTGTDANLAPSEPVIGAGGSTPNMPEHAADYSCKGTRARPADGALVPFNLRVRDFQEETAVSAVMLRVFADNVITDGACTAPTCFEAMTNAEGIASVMGRTGGWYALRILPKSGPSPGTTIVGSVQINEIVPASGGMADADSVSQRTLNLIPSALGFPRAPGTAIVAGNIVDCEDDDVWGAKVRLFRGDGTEITEGVASAEPHFRYFDGDEFPSSTQPYSNVDGLFAVANVPPTTGSDRLRIEIWGRRTEAGVSELLACEEVNAYADSVALLAISPLRSDAPASCTR